MSQFKDNWTLNTGDLRGKNCFVSERVIYGLLEQSSGNPVPLYYNSPYTVLYKGDSSGIILPNAKTLDLNWRVEIINEGEETSIPIFLYGSEEGDPYTVVSTKSQKTFILIGQNTEAGEWTTLKTGEIELDSAIHYYNTYKNVGIGWNELEDNLNKVLVNIKQGYVLKSIMVKTSVAFDASTKLSIGTKEQPTLFINQLDLTTEVSEDNFIRELFEQVLSTKEDLDVIATFSTTGSVTKGNVNIILEYQNSFIPYRLSQASFTINQPLGSIFPYIFSTLPKGYGRLDGSLIPNFQENYPEFYKKLLDEPNLVISLYQWLQEYNNKKSCGKFAWDGTSLKLPAINAYMRGTTDLVETGQVILNPGNIFSPQTNKQDSTVFYPYIICLSNEPQEIRNFEFGGED